MACYIKDGAYPLYDHDIRAAFPKTSFPQQISAAQAAEFGYAFIAPTQPPAEMPWHTVAEGAPAGGVQTWHQAPISVEDTIARCTAALEAHYDAVAQERRYDDRYTCALRAGYPGPFQAEGQAFAVWMDECNLRAYQLMAAVQFGTRAMPATTDALLGELALMVWPA